MMSKIGGPKEFWEQRFRNSSTNYKLLARRDFSNVVNLLKKFRVTKVLDLRCGYGHWSIVLARAGFYVKAVDISSKAIRKVQSWACEEGFFINVEVCSAQEIRLVEKFDAIICNSVLDHMCFTDARKVMSNIKQILNSDGILYLSLDGVEEENEEDFIVLNDGTRKYIKGKRKGMIWRYYTNEEIKVLCKDLQIIEFKEEPNGRRVIWCPKFENFAYAKSLKRYNLRLVV